VDDTYAFSPPQQVGILFNLMIVLILGGIGAWSIVQASRTEVGTSFLLYLLVGLVALSITPAFAYRLRALLGAFYELKRDGIRLKWGLRAEDIPMDKVLWVNHAHDMEPAVPLPLVYWPGSVLGTRRTKEGIVVEFFSARSTSLILVATKERVFAISPEDPEAFLTTFETLAQLGSLAPLPAKSIYPSFLMARVWKDRAARAMLLGSLASSLALLIWVSLIIPTYSQVSLDLTPESQSLDFVPSIQLLLLPALNGVFFGADLLLGLFFYRRADPQSSSEVEQSTQSWDKTLAYLLWGSGLLTSLLFLGAVFFITRIASIQ
jgi:hypothetical protein